MVQFELRRTDWSSYNWGVLVIGRAPDGWSGLIIDEDSAWPFSGTVWAFFDLYEACVSETENPDNQIYPHSYFRITEQEDGILLEHSSYDALRIETTYDDLHSELEELFMKLFELMDANTIPPGKEDAIYSVDGTYDFDAQRLYEDLMNGKALSS